MFCLVSGPSPYVVFAAADGIYRVNLDTTSLRPIINQSNNVIAVDYDARYYRNSIDYDATCRGTPLSLPLH